MGAAGKPVSVPPAWRGKWKMGKRNGQRGKESGDGNGKWGKKEWERGDGKWQMGKGREAP